MISTFELIKKTLPFIWLRIGIYAIMSFLSFILVIGVSWIGWRVIVSFGANAFTFTVFIFLLTLLGGFGIMRWIERYFIYLVKAGHVYAMTELIDKGELPEGKGQIAFAKDEVVRTFGKTSVFFGVNVLVDGAVRQIQRWLMKTANFLSFIPNIHRLMGIISKILGTAIRYVDEAVLSYTMRFGENGKSVWRNSADGVVYYAQSWKGMLKSAVIIVLLTWGTFWGTFFITANVMSLIVTFEGDYAILNILPILFGFFLASNVRKAFIDPIATAIMVREFHKNVENQELKMDLGKKLYNVSNKFREFFQKDKEEANVDATLIDEVEEPSV